MQMRNALPNAFLFGLTGTPINTRDRSTFYAFGAPEDEGGYLSRYSFEESIRDEATLPLQFETRSVDLRIDRAALDQEFENLTEALAEEDRAEISRRAGRFSLLVKAPDRVGAVVADIRQHFVERLAPDGFGAMIVTVDQEACVLYKDALDALADDDLPVEASDVVMNMGQGAPPEWRRRFGRSKEEEAALLDRFRDPVDPLKIIIVTAKLLTGFDAPNLQCLYLDRSLRDHNLLQAICRTNRPAPGKSHGLIVDYLGIFDDVAQALAFDEESIEKVIANLDELKEAPRTCDGRKCLGWFPNVDRTAGGMGRTPSCPGVPSRHREPRCVCGGLLDSLPSVGGALPRPGTRSDGGRLPMAGAGVRLPAAPVGQRQAALARAGVEDDRFNPQARHGSGRPRRPRHARHGRRGPRAAA